MSFFARIMLYGLFAFLIQCFAHNTTCRIAYYLGGNEELVLTRFQSCGYNYVMWNFTPLTIEAEVTRIAQLVYSYGQMRLIPVLGINNGSFARWGIDWQVWDPSIQLNVINRSAEADGPYGANSFAPGGGGIDLAVEQVLRTIRNGFNNAALPYTLEMIHFAYDEFTYDFMLPGGGGGSCLLYSAPDRDYINNRIFLGDSPQMAFERLILESINSRLTTVQKMFGKGTKIIIFGDAFDPQHEGRNAKETFLLSNATPDSRPISWFGTTPVFQQTNKTYISVTLYPSILTLRALPADSRSNFFNNVILMPWRYSNDNAPVSNTYSYFSNCSNTTGFKFIYMCAVHPGGPGDDPITYFQGGIDAMHNYRNEADNFNSNCIGYSVAYWDGYSNSICANMIEILASANKVGDSPLTFHLFPSIVIPIISNIY